MDKKNTITQGIDRTKIPLSLGSKISWQIIVHLYHQHFINESGLYYSKKLLIPKYHWGLLIEQLFYIISTILLFYGTSALIALKWLELPQSIQKTSIFLLLIGTGLSVWVFGIKAYKTKIYVCLGTLLLCASLYHFQWIGNHI